MKIEKISLSDRAAQQIRQMVVCGDLAPGQRLTEQEFSDEMQVGRGTVRAALALLESENLVVRRPYSGWAILNIDNDVLQESYQVRSALEELSVRLLARNLDDEKTQRLITTYEQLVQAEEGGGAEDRMRADLQFHAGIVQDCGNSLLSKQYKSISGRIEWLYRWSENNWPHRINLVDWHKPIFDAILAQDDEAAVQAVRIHTERSLFDDKQDLQSEPPDT